MCLLRVVTLAVLLLGAVTYVHAEPPQLKLRVLPGDWGDAGIEDIAAVCESAAREILQHCGDRQLEPVTVRYDKAGPMVIFGVGDSGERRVLLHVRDTHWAQFAFQFSHELGHVLCNYREANRNNLWFEESLCEAASLFALRRMAESWKTDPPYSNWKGYSSSLAEYAQDRIDAAKLHAGQSLSDWYGEHADTLRDDPTNRKLNQIVAVALLELLEKNPQHWQSLASLNQHPPNARLSFVEYLSHWHDQAPRDQQAFITDLARVLGVKLEPTK